jgi:hypothetical protein
MVKQESKIRTNDKKSVLAAVLALAVGSVASCAALAAVSGCPDFEVEPPRATGGPVVRAADFGFSTTDDNNAAALTRAFEHCRKVGASKLLLAPGKYYCRAEAGVMMEGLKDLTVEGEGAVLIFDRPSVFRDVEYWRVEISPDYGNFRIRDCERVKLRNFSVDWDWDRDPLAAFVRVTALHVDNVATNASYFEVEFVDYDRYPVYPRPLSIQTMADMDENRRVFADQGACRYYGTEEGHFSTKFAWLAPNRVRLWPGVKPVEDLPMNSWRKRDYSLTNPDRNRALVRSLKEGRLYRLGHYYVGKNCFDMLSNRHLTFEDVNVYSCRGDAFHVEGRQEYWQYIRVKVRPPEDVTKAGGGPKLRPMTTTLDVMHIGRSCGHLKLISFECTLNQDDHANFHDRFSAIRKVGPRLAEITQGRGNGYFQAAPGTPLEFRNSDLSPAGFTARVARVIDDSHLEFDRELPERFAAEDAFVFDRAYGTDNVLVKDCVYESCWGRFLLLSHNATFENCVWRHGIASGVLVQQGFKYGYWAEGFGSGNVVIRNCTFDALQRFNRPARSGGPVCDLFVGVNLDTAGRELSRLSSVWPGLIDGVLIEGNTFIDPRGAILHVANGTNIVFRNNRIVRTAKGNPHPLPYAGEVIVDPAAKGGVFVEPPTECRAQD